jgi:aminopeptidase N
MKKIALLFSILGIVRLSAQESATRKDSLQGGLRVERTCFDVLRYDLNFKINPEERSILGFNEITFRVIDKTARIQLDLFANMRIDSIVFNKKQLQYKREFNAVFIDFPEVLNQNSEQKVTFYYAGNPIVAKRAPWDGGFVFRKDSNGNDFIGVACQGTGASLWFPCKDSQSDEPDQGATIKVAIPNGLTNVSNGRLLGSTDLKNGYTRWDWEVKNPINSYDITVNIGDYVHFGENYKGLDLDFYVLRENEAKAKIQFEVVKPMMDCFQAKFGAYPFATDGYKLVETSYLGMEHQSAVAYGNKYLKGYLGSDLSGTGVGLLFDFIIIHESGHEWFGNSITSRDIADMWIHEGFTCYTESVFLECQYGYEKAQIYINGLKRNIQNDKPIIGSFGINKEGSSDMYNKGALMLNTIRSVVNDDDKWWKILLKYSQTFRHKIIDTQTVINFFNQESAINLTPVFNQYLQYKDIPTLELRLKKKKLQYKWKTDVANFNMPIDINIDNKITRLYPSNKWNTANFIVKQLKSENIATNRFFVNVSIK